MLFKCISPVFELDVQEQGDDRPAADTHDRHGCGVGVQVSVGQVAEEHTHQCAVARDDGHDTGGCCFVRVHLIRV